MLRGFFDFRRRGLGRAARAWAVAASPSLSAVGWPQKQAFRRAIHELEKSKRMLARRSGLSSCRTAATEAVRLLTPRPTAVPFLQLALHGRELRKHSKGFRIDDNCCNQPQKGHDAGRLTPHCYRCRASTAKNAAAHTAPPLQEDHCCLHSWGCSLASVAAAGGRRLASPSSSDSLSSCGIAMQRLNQRNLGVQRHRTQRIWNGR